MKIQMPFRCHLFPPKIAKRKKIMKISHVGKGLGKREFSNTDGGDVNWKNSLKGNWIILIKSLKISISYSVPVIPLLRIYPKTAAGMHKPLSSTCITALLVPGVSELQPMDQIRPGMFSRGL